MLDGRISGLMDWISIYECQDALKIPQSWHVYFLQKSGLLDSLSQYLMHCSFNGWCL